KAVCAGYAMAMQYILNKLGIECLYVKGDTPRGYHAWNILKLEGEYYLMDATWGDSSDTDKKQSQEGVGYNYFCVNDEIAKVDHTPDVTYPLPACTSMKYNWHRHYNLWFDRFVRSQVEEAVVRELKRDRSVISLRFATKTESDRAVADLVDKQEISGILLHAEMKLGIKLSDKYTWTRHPRAHTLTFYVTRL
ncbi:MAG: hypothetical protein IJN58_08290, partial [Clostridia bacterium]|nr:hypothetical protein [Clostridia bacterium]